MMRWTDGEEEGEEQPKEWQSILSLQKMKNDLEGSLCLLLLLMNNMRPGKDIARCCPLQPRCR